LLKIVAHVNGADITWDELAQQCIRRHGKEVLETMANKHLIAEECRRRGINVSRAEVDAEVERLARRFGLPVEQWLKMLKQERGITPAQYANDVIWPMLALRKLAGERLRVTEEELRAAYESHYGPSVRCRLIALRDRRAAEQVHAAAVANPEEFGDLAKQYSEDASASLKGLIQPIRRHTGFPELEQAAFSLTDGEISPVIQAAGQFIILKREKLLPASNVRYDQVAPQLEEIVREKKLRAVATETFQQLQQGAQVEILLNDPAKSRAAPGVAATINGAPILLSDLAQHCVERHGEEVLEGMIHRRLIQQACEKRKLTIGDKEIEEEIARAASEMVPPLADGRPDVAAWLKLVAEQQGMPLDVYRSEVVWPSAALRKLVLGAVKVSEEDLQKGFEANYGPRVRCRAIVLGNFRRAQEVWEKARRNATVEFFGALAEQYSIEPGSQALRGEVPPIRKHGGQPALEKEAFALKPGELSGIIQLGDKFVILYCEGHTKPVTENLAEVRDLLYQDIFEKKVRQAMGEYFAHLKESATIDNYLAGTTHSPNSRLPSGELPVRLPAQRPISGNSAPPGPAGGTAARPAGVGR
jgi:parvulin-like peptidyl-prolyl isomerase